MRLLSDMSRQGRLYRPPTARVALHGEDDSLDVSGSLRPILTRALSGANIPLIRERQASAVNFERKTRGIKLTNGDHHLLLRLRISLGDCLV